MTRTPHIQPNATCGRPPANTTVHTGERGTDGFGTLATHNIQYHSALKAPPISGEGLGRGFFGARYYDAGLSIWLSVDPMSDERAWLSPYNYCQLRPLLRLDPDGMLDVINDWKPVVNEAGKLVYQPESTDNFFTFMADFNITREQAIQIFVNNGLVAYLPYNIQHPNGFNQESALFIPEFGAGNYPLFNEGSGLRTQIEVHYPLKMRYERFTAEDCLAQFAMVQRWISVNEISQFNWKTAFNTCYSWGQTGVVFRGSISVGNTSYNLELQMMWGMSDFEMLGQPVFSNYTANLNERWRYYHTDNNGTIKPSSAMVLYLRPGSYGFSNFLTNSK